MLVDINGVYYKTVEFAGGSAVFYGDINVGGAIYINGLRAKLALQAFSRVASDGQVLSWPDLGAVPGHEFDVSALPALPNGQQYEIRLLNKTPTGATMSAKITTPGTPSLVSQGPGAAIGGTPSHRIAKASAQDSQNGFYGFTISVFNDAGWWGGGGPQYQPEITNSTVTVDCYVRPAGRNWIFVGTVEGFVWRDQFGQGSTTLESSVYFAGALGSDGQHQFGVSPRQNGDGSTTTISQFVSVTYQGVGASGSSTPVPQSIPVRIIPQNA